MGPPVTDLRAQCAAELKRLKREGKTGLKFKLHSNSDTAEPTVDGWVIYDDSGFSLSNTDLPQLEDNL